MASTLRRRSHRMSGAAAVSIIATAGIFGTYLGNPRTPRAYAQPGAPFEAMFAPPRAAGIGTGVEPRSGWLDQVAGDSARVASTQARVQTFPFTCSFSVDDSVSLHAAVRSSTDDSIICVTDDIPDLSEQLVIDDTNLTIVGAAGDDSLANVTLTADDTRHIHATFDDTEGSLALFNLTFANGYARSDNGGSVYIDGALSASGGTSLLLRDDTFIGNRVSGSGSGGAVYAKELEVFELKSIFAGSGVSFVSNSAGGNGGAIRLRNVENTVVENSSLSRNYAGLSGGAMSVFTTSTGSQVTINDSRFVDDSAGFVGGAIAAGGLSYPVLIQAFGSRVDEDRSSTVFSGNSAGSGGAIWLSDVGYDSYVRLALVGSIEVEGNTAVNGDGGAIYLYDDSVGTPSVFPTFINLLAINYDSDDPDGTVVFSNNYANGDGGAVHITGAIDSGGLTASYYFDLSRYTGASFVGNEASGRGGAVYVDGSWFSWKSSLVGNIAGGAGGAVAVDDSVMQPLSYLFSGAAIAATYFADNVSRDDSGGAVFVDDTTGRLAVVSSTFARNSAGSAGGAIAVLDDTGQIDNSTFTLNTAPLGGGLFMNSGELALNFSTLTGNSAVYGGGIVGRRLSIANSIVNDNDVNLGPRDAIAYDSIDDSYSLFSSPTSMVAINPWTPGPGTRFSAGPVVEPLGDNGGFRVADDTVIPTMLPFAGSPVIDSADPNSSGTNFFLGNFDERGDGFPRIVGGRADMGAVERQAAPVPPTPTPASGPREVKAAAGDREVTVTWQAPSSSGSFPITSYQAVATAEGEQGSSGPSCLVTAPALTCTITGLTDGQTYTVRVRALTGAGWGAFSDPSEPFTPQPPEVKSIVITGTREGRQTVVVQGATTGLVGQRVRAQVRLQGQSAYVAGSTRVVDEAGEFTWRRQTRKKTYVYFVAEDGGVRSKRLIIRR